MSYIKRRDDHSNAWLLSALVDHLVTKANRMADANRP